MSGEHLALFARRVHVPPAGEIGGEARNLVEPDSFAEKAANHSRELSDLHVLEAKLAIELSRETLSEGGSEPLLRGGRKNLFFFHPGVRSKHFVECFARGAGCYGIGGVHRGQELPEEIIQSAVLRGETFEESFRNHSAFLVPHCRPRTGSRISASGSPASKPKRAATVLAIEIGETLGPYAPWRTPGPQTRSGTLASSSWGWPCVVPASRP